MTMIIGLHQIFIAFISFLVFQCFLSYKKRQKPLPTNWPVLGMLPGWLSEVPRIYHWLTELLEASNMTFVFKGPWLCRLSLLLTADPVNVHYILSSNFVNYPKGKEFKMIFDVLGDGIFNADSGLWEDLRSSSHAIFSHKDFEKFSVNTSVSKLRQELVPILENAIERNIIVDLQDLVRRFLFDTSLILMTGYDPQCLSIEMPKVEFFDVVDDFMDGLFYRHVLPVNFWKLQNWFNVGQEKKMRRASMVFDQFMEEIISAKREEIKSHGTRHHLQGEAMNILTYYMTMDTTKYKHLKPNNDKLLSDIILGFLCAGRDTTSSAITWLFWLLSKNPEATTKIRNEINKNMPKYDPVDLDKLVYLHGAICETLRLYPPIPFNHKSPAKPDVLPSGHRVDENMKILISMYSTGRMTSIWGDDAEDFRPERWILDSGKIKHEPSNKFVVFGAGPRTCLGRKLSVLQAKTVAVEIIRNYNIKVVDEHKTELVPSVVIRMKNGLKVSFSKI